MVIPLEGSITGRALRSGETFFFSRVPEGLAEYSQRIVSAEQFQSGCFVPIKRAGKTLGILHLLDRTQAFFDESDKELFEQIARQLAIGLENALKYEEAEAFA